MAVQQQSRQTSQWWEDEEEEEQRSTYTTVRHTTAERKEPARKKKPFGKILAGILAIAAAGTGILFYNRTPLFADTTAPEECLPLNEYLLLDENGNKEGSLMNPFYEGDWYYYGDEAPHYTTRGITAGDSWDDFVREYGNYTAYSISIYPEEYIPYDEQPDDYYDTHYFYYMNVAEFDREYIQSGKVDLSENEIYVDFSVYVYGRHTAYTENEYDTILDLHYSNNMPDGSIFDPQLQRYTLEFTFGPKDAFWRSLPEDGALHSFSYDHYAY